MAKYKSDPKKQPELIAEPRADYTVTPEQQAEKETYRERLRLHLKDPAFRQIEGFPIGKEEDILEMSDPPYYTACPNPFLDEIITLWQQERLTQRQTLGLPTTSLLQWDDELVEGYHREPFATDVSEGKSDPIYNAHTYHTKVPHKAIMRYILHYTDPGDIILDGFCGTGMTGVAAQLCGDKKTIESLGYYADKKGMVYDGQPQQGGKLISRVGYRKAVLADLSPAATFISYNYNTPVDARAFEKEARRILAEVEKECGWMYETWHNKGDGIKGVINYTVWSDVFICPQCGGEMVLWDVAVDQNKKQVNDNWDCPHCRARLSKNPKKGSGAQRVERAFQTVYDRALGQNLRQAKQTPVLINYNVGKKRFDKPPDAEDLALISKIDDGDIPYPFPAEPMMFKGVKWGDTWRAGIHASITNVHHFYNKRNLWVLSCLWARIQLSCSKFPLQFMLTAAIRYLSRLSKLGTTYFFSKGGGVINAGISGTLFVPSFSAENNVLRTLSIRIPKLSRVLNGIAVKKGNLAISTQSSSKGNIGSNSIDYIFIDPPFGDNLIYSELNFIWEAWFKVFTNNQPEAIVTKAQRKGLPEYQELIEECFDEFYRVLKPGHWMTIEFHNSQNSVWNAIQEGLLRAGFMIADVRTLDKQQGSFKQVTSTSAVKDDLIISAYKPDTVFERHFISEGGSIQGAWDFIRQHIDQLPIPSLENDVMESLPERQGYLLYDRMVAFHIQRGLSVPLSATEFYTGLPQRFLDRDGMYFTPAQAAEYDKRRLGAQKVEQLALFVTDEKSALQWLRRELDPEAGGGPQTYQDLQPKFIRELRQARHEALPELRTILEQNFLQDPAERWYTPNPEHQADLDALRQKALLREFGEYLAGKGRLKVFRSEAVRAGFSHAWKERDYEAILKVAERLPEAILQEDQSLLMYVHNAALRRQEQPRQMPLI